MKADSISADNDETEDEDDDWWFVIEDLNLLAIDEADKEDEDAVDENWEDPDGFINDPAKENRDDGEDDVDAFVAFFLELCWVDSSLLFFNLCSIDNLRANNDFIFDSSTCILKKMYFYNPNFF